MDILNSGLTLKVFIRLVLGLGVLLLLILLSLPFPPSEAEARHDRHLEQLTRAFNRLPHPTGTSRLQLISNLGVLSGNGNHCDFFVGELRSYSGSRQQIVDFYEGLTIKNLLMPDGQQPVEVDFFYQGKLSQDSSVPPRYWLETDWKIPQQEARNLYVVYVLDISHNPEEDGRCH